MCHEVTSMLHQSGGQSKVHPTSSQMSEDRKVQLFYYVMVCYRILLVRFQMTRLHRSWSLSFLSNTLVTLAGIWAHLHQHIRCNFITLDATFVRCLGYCMGVYCTTGPSFSAPSKLAKIKYSGQCECNIDKGTLVSCCIWIQLWDYGYYRQIPWRDILGPCKSGRDMAQLQKKKWTMSLP